MEIYVPRIFGDAMALKATTWELQMHRELYFIYYSCAMFTLFLLLLAFVDTLRHWSEVHSTKRIVCQRKVKRKLLSVQKSFNSFNSPWTRLSSMVDAKWKNCEILNEGERVREIYFFSNCVPNQSMTNCIILICGTKRTKSLAKYCTNEIITNNRRGGCECVIWYRLIEQKNAANYYLYNLYELVSR